MNLSNEQYVALSQLAYIDLPLSLKNASVATIINYIDPISGLNLVDINNSTFDPLLNLGSLVLINIQKLQGVTLQSPLRAFYRV